MSQEQQHIVQASEAGKRLDQLLATLSTGLSRSQLEDLIEAGEVTVAGKTLKKSYRVREQDIICIKIPPPPPTTPQAQDLPLDILYQDSELLVINKAPGMVVHPAAGAPDGTLVNALLYHFDDFSEQAEENRPGIVHRLDKDTSGCLVVARTPAALAALQKAFADRQTKKLYHAICHGVPKQTPWTLDTDYGRHAHHRTHFTCKNPTGIVRRAVSHIKTTQVFEGASLLEVTIETGRTHQIRVHLSEHGHPLLADTEYGGHSREARFSQKHRLRRAAEAIGRQALHAFQLSFPHPSDGRTMSFEAPLPSDFQAALQILQE